MEHCQDADLFLHYPIKDRVRKLAHENATYIGTVNDRTQKWGTMNPIEGFADCNAKLFPEVSPDTFVITVGFIELGPGIRF